MNIKITAILLAVSLTGSVCVYAAPPIQESTLATPIDEKIIDGLEYDLYPAFTRVIDDEEDETYWQQGNDAPMWSWIKLYVDDNITKDIDIYVDLMVNAALLLESIGGYTKFVNTLRVVPHSSDGNKEVLEIVFADSKCVVPFAEWRKGKPHTVTSVTVPKEFLIQLGSEIGIWDQESAKEVPPRDLYRLLEMHIYSQGGIARVAKRFGYDGNLIDDRTLADRGEEVLRDQRRVSDRSRMVSLDTLDKKYKITHKIRTVRAFIRTMDLDAFTYEQTVEMYDYLFKYQIGSILAGQFDIQLDPIYLQAEKITSYNNPHYKTMIDRLNNKPVVRLLDDIVEEVYWEVNRYMDGKDVVDPRDFMEKNPLVMAWLSEFQYIYIERFLMKRLLMINGDYTDRFLIEKEEAGPDEVGSVTHPIIFTDNETGKTMTLYIMFEDEQCVITVYDDKNRKALTRQIEYVREGVFYYERLLAQIEHDLRTVAGHIFEQDINGYHSEVGLAVNYDGKQVTLRGRVDARHVFDLHTIVMYGHQPSDMFLEHTRNMGPLEAGIECWYLGTETYETLRGMSSACAHATSSFALHLKQLAELPAVELIYQNGSVIKGNLEWAGDTLVIRQKGVKIVPRIPGLRRIEVLDRIEDEPSNALINSIPLHSA